MKRYPEQKQLNLPRIAEEILEFWQSRKVFEQSISTRQQAESYVFYEGPPSANGMPGIHHVMARTIKDIFCRYQTLKGKQVHRKAGWDTHGLPIELAVEKSLGISKEDIGTKLSVEDYNRACRKEVMKYTDKWVELTRLMGYWVDMQQPYITYDNKYIESVWYLLKKLYEQNLLYKGYTIQPYSPAAGTGLSSHELNQPGCYRNVKDRSAVAMFKVIRNQKSDFLFSHSDVPVYFLAWTTTPWTLPSNTALAVGQDYNYVVIRTKKNEEDIDVIIESSSFTKYIELSIPESFLAKDVNNKNDSDSLFLGGISEDDFKNVEKILAKASNLSTLDAIPQASKPFKQNNPAGIYHKLFKGQDLEGIAYEQLLPFEANSQVDLNGQQVPFREAAGRVVLGDFVTTEDGTGIVHIAPSFGADDFKVARQNGIGSLTMVDRRGRFLKGIADGVFLYGDEYVKEAYLSDDEKQQEFLNQKNILEAAGKIKELKAYLSVDERIVLKLQEEGKLFKKETYEHNYPHCWRTDKPVLYYPLDSWFVKVTDRKQRMVELNQQINWKPESIGTGRFGNWLENANDWNLSRSRFWGIPLPVWRTKDGLEECCIGSAAELKSAIEKSMGAGFMQSNPLKDFAADDFSESNYNSFDLHKPYADEIVLCSPSGKPMLRESDLIDVWFDSGAMPYAQLHYPFENKELVDNRKNFPADFIAEGVDQTRGWFYTLHAIATLCFDSVAYKNVVSNGLVLDKNGNKMSKRLGNAINPFDTLAKYGPDATRWYMITNAQPWDNLKFDLNGITEVQHKFFGTLYNTYGFFALYANIDDFDFANTSTVSLGERPELDRWILSKLNSLRKEVYQALDDYEPTKAARAIEEFTDVHLSNWYVRLSRRRFWSIRQNDAEKNQDNDKLAAYQTLHECLATVAQLMSPFAPFFADWLYRNLHGHSDESVHLSYLKAINEEAINPALERQMELAQRISSMVLSIRKKENLRVRQPLNTIRIPVMDDTLKNDIEKVKSLILSEVNVKHIEFVGEADTKIIKNLKLNFKTLGKKCGRHMKAVQQWAADNSTLLIEQIEQMGHYTLSLENDEIVIDNQDVEIMAVDIPGWKVTNQGNLTVALDITLNEQLKDEGLSRELINRIQNLRKDSGYDVTDRIEVRMKSHPEMDKAVKNNLVYICSEILASSIEIVTELNPKNSALIEIDEAIKTEIEISKLN
jgi:isoleucyl-tRNA synthetase